LLTLCHVKGANAFLEVAYIRTTQPTYEYVDHTNNKNTDHCHTAPWIGATPAPGFLRGDEKKCVSARVHYSCVG